MDNICLLKYSGEFVFLVFCLFVCLYFSLFLFWFVLVLLFGEENRYLSPPRIGTTNKATHTNSGKQTQWKKEKKKKKKITQSFVNVLWLKLFWS